MVITHQRRVTVVVNPTYPTTLTTRAGPDADGHRIDRARPTGRITSLEGRRPLRRVVRPKRRVLTKAHLTPPRPILPRGRDGTKEGQDTSATVRQDGRDGRVTPIQRAPRKVITKHKRRVGILTGRPAGPTTTKTHLPAPNGTDGVGRTGPRTCLKRTWDREGVGPRRVPAKGEEDTLPTI